MWVLFLLYITEAFADLGYYLGAFEAHSSESHQRLAHVVRYLVHWPETQLSKNLTYFLQELDFAYFRRVYLVVAGGICKFGGILELFQFRFSPCIHLYYFPCIIFSFDIKYAVFLSDSLLVLKSK